MNLADWAQVALSLVVMLTGLYLALVSPRGRSVLATTRVAGLGVALLGLSYLVGGLEGRAVEGLLLDRIEAYSALVGICSKIAMMALLCAISSARGSLLWYPMGVFKRFRRRVLGISSRPTQKYAI